MRTTKRRIVLASAVSLLFGTLAAGCGGAADEGGNQTPDGVQKNYSNVGNKGDKWNDLNDPARFQTDLNRNWEELKSEARTGRTENEVWPATYWPLYKDGINQRWQGDDTPSPAEKYDLVFNGWTPEQGFEEFMSLQPYDHNTCEWDEAYYESLGPAAEAAAREGNWKAHNGRDDDGDGVADKNECGTGENADYDGVETWFGLCHAWAPAAILQPEPKEPVTMSAANGRDVTFDVADIKALIISQYDQSESFMVGGRCNEKDPERTSSGRIPDGKCQDVNAGSFHLLMTNFLGLNGRPIVEDRVYNYEVWNQPIIGYEITEQKEIEESRVKELVNPEAAGDEGVDQPATEEEKTATLRAANTLSESEMIEGAGMREDRASMLVDYRQSEGEFEEIPDIISQVGTRSVARLLDYTYEQNWLEEQPAVYDYDKDADRFVEVKMRVDYVVESSPMAQPLYDRIEDFTEHDNYHYILELREDGTITGGEWVGRSIDTHPDFLWLPTGPGGGNEHVELEKVEQLLAKSTDGSDSNSSNSRFESTETVAIPDNDADGATSTIDVEREGNVSSVKLDLQIDHTYGGDLVIRLEKGGVKSLVYNGPEQDEPWTDGLELDGKTIQGFAGTELQGTWTLRVVDVKSPDTGEIKSWALEPTVD